VNRWMTYLLERSPIVPLTLMALGVGFSGEALGRHHPRATPVAVSVAGILLFLFLARLMDEKKDFEKDKVAHPDRPLPRGLLSIADVERGLLIFVAVCFVFAAVVGSLFGIVAGALYVLTTAFLWLMYREFYVGEALAKRPVLYAVSHQLVIFPMYGFAFALTSPEATFSRAAVGYCVASLGANMAYEIMRKLDPHAHPVLKTYLAIFGPGKTLALIAFFLGVAAVGACMLGLFARLIWVDLCVALAAILVFVRPGRYKFGEAAAAIGLLSHLWSVFAAYELGWL
jgi:4-hydroxybenzoate polyprenyltransferase